MKGRYSLKHNFNFNIFHNLTKLFIMIIPVSVFHNICRDRMSIATKKKKKKNGAANGSQLLDECMAGEQVPWWWKYGTSFSMASMDLLRINE